MPTVAIRAVTRLALLALLAFALLACCMEATGASSSDPPVSAAVRVDKAGNLLVESTTGGRVLINGVRFGLGNVKPVA